MRAVCATAPGKAILCGEYAVLFGARALVTALSRRARVVATPNPGRGNELTAGGIVAGHWSFDAAAGGGIRWSGPGRDTRLAIVESAWNAASPDPAVEVSLQIDTSAFCPAAGTTKLGIGSSAAVAVALHGALSAINGSPRDPQAAIVELRSRLQGGHGSGADIAASLLGGVIDYSMHRAPMAMPLAWPQGLYVKFLWSGREADTESIVRQLGDRAGREAEAGPLTRAANRAAQDFAAGKVRRFLDGAADFVVELQKFSQRFDIGVFDGGHAELVGLAKQEGVVYKPCGAGGGDIGAVFAENPGSVARFAASAARLGFEPLELEMDPGGLRIEEGAGG